MSGGWASSRRRQELPADWFRPGGPRDRTLSAPRGRSCKLKFEGCTKFATQVDHIVPGNDHSDANLQSVCGPCHAKKSALEGVEARRAARPQKPIHPSLR